ncbi:DUF2794 domain-containing protein [Altererythrobacter sp. H2]|uniref:DUF2794 domain-containing protein n=1 Tax=Altererythrobacter sp. H2 TaxID=3108391 RepID=UPI000BCC7768|nr:DUF2794 domain-containing protein [Altererythrobacter sp. H2]OZA94252.1 MAG: hypothetical protein B7X57_02175 [Erythrobacter sp. 34-65-8]WRK97245.1 DUF2794 domain-containing protein [Altererythrobacter sp. H2]
MLSGGGGGQAGGPGGTIVAFPSRQPDQVGFSREELSRILDTYGRMVSAGQWRDYAMDFTRDFASFAAFKRTAERPQARIEKRPSLRSRQGMWTLYGEHGQVLKRGHDLAGVLAPIERRLVKVVTG